MENTVLAIDVMSPKEWIMISHAITLEEGKIKIRASKAETTMAAYFNEATLFQIPVLDILKEPYNSYRITCTGYSTDALDAQIGITRYFEDDSNFTQFYEINKVIEIGSEGITAFSFILKFIGTGEFSLQQLSITTFLNNHKYHTEHKSIKVNEVISKMVIPITGEKIYRSSVKMATILDEFSFKCFKEEAQCYPITASHWREELDTFKPEVLFVESAWHGKDHSWEQKIACYKQECSEELKELIQYCKQQGIKTVFWNKEGLVNFEYFKSASALFETVFVTDERMIEEQKQLCGHERVYILPFAAQPKLHNSINKHAYYLGEIAFAGNWYGDKHPRRLVDMQNILEPALEFDLDIYDRSYERRKELIQAGYYWPYPYRSSIVGGVSYEIMVQLYKYYHIFLNVNSVQDSKWMIARRVYEIMATKTVVVSGYALSIETQMKDYIYYSQSEEETRKILNFLIDHPILRDQKGKKAQRYILENHTYEKRLEQILRTIGLPYEIRIKPMVSIIVWIESLEELCSLYSQVKRQSYEKIQLKVFYSTANKELEDLKFDQENIELCPVQPKNLVQAILSQCTKKFFGEYMTMMCSEYIYGEHYIRDYVNTFEYIEADIIGKSTVFYYRVSAQNLYKVNYGVGEDCYCEGVIPGSWMIKCKALTYEMLEALLKANTIRNYMNRLGEKKYRIYSDDAFNICLLGEDVPIEAEFIAHTPNYRLIIEV